MPYKKYKNTYGWCKYPFENNLLGYCYTYARMVGKKKSKEEILKSCSQKVKKGDKHYREMGLKVGDYWCEYYKPNKDKK